MAIVRVVALVADLHQGTQYSLAPEGFKLKEGNEVILNDGQKMILEFWHVFWEIAYKRGVDTIVWNGDLIHGQNPKERGIQLLTSDLDEQIEMAITAIHPVAKGRKNHFLSGSGYHKAIKGGNPEKYICDRLRGPDPQVPLIEATWHGPLAVGPFSPSELIWFISHGESQAYIYRSQVLDRENLHLNAAIALDKVPRIRVVAHAHWHCSQTIKLNRQWHIQIPGWCAFIPWKGSMILYPKMQPDIGGMIVYVEEDKITVEEYLMPELPKICDSIREM